MIHEYHFLFFKGTCSLPRAHLVPHSRLDLIFYKRLPAATVPFMTSKAFDVLFHSHQFCRVVRRALLRAEPELPRARLRGARATQRTVGGWTEAKLPGRRDCGAWDTLWLY
ncbi:hypothetical protein NDU88_001445 [Pleurodeles waltl]|uniref:Uncharacterized protein n=1 Tax=Pleurodeles waltl TaxID=8319 RepID=A0AAV7M166_PLEWA|nr:hypothetical protein NDU88_001445 [Pleurodeles waltl]